MNPALIGSPERYLANTAPYRDRAQLLNDYSTNVAPGWTTALDFLFIDGDHSYPTVERDYREWSPFVKPGGLLAMHDARANRPGGSDAWPGPSAVADRFIYDCPREWEIVGEELGLVVARRVE